MKASATAFFLTVFIVSAAWAEDAMPPPPPPPPGMASDTAKDAAAAPELPAPPPLPGAVENAETPPPPAAENPPLPAVEAPADDMATSLPELPPAMPVEPAEATAQPAPAPESPESLPYQFGKSSSEMDFDVPPVLAPTEGEALPERKDVVKEVERFFSDTELIKDKEKDATPEKKAEVKKPKKRKYVARQAPKPPFNFKSVRLPPTIYKKRYSKDNQHLPTAVFESDLQHAVILAAVRGDIDTLRALRDRGLWFDMENDQGEPLLTTTIRYGQVNAAIWLLRQGVPSNRMNAEGLTPLHFAAYLGDARLVQFLLASGANPMLSDPNGITPLMVADRRGAKIAAAILQQAMMPMLAAAAPMPAPPVPGNTGR